MFKKIQWMFTIYFLNSNYKGSVQYLCLFLRLGAVVIVSGSVKATQCHKLTLKSLLNKLYRCSEVEKRSCGHTGQDCEQIRSYDLHVVCLKCNVNML